MVRKIVFATVIGLGLAGAGQANAAGAATQVAAGGIVGGLVGAVYKSGFSATAASVTSAVTGTVSSVVGIIPATATGIAGTIASTSTPVLAGVVIGGSAAYLMYRSAR